MSAGAIRLFCERLGGWSQGHPRVTLGVLGALTVGSIALMGRLTISTSLADVIGDASPAAKAITIIGGRFDVGEDLLVVATDAAAPDTASAASALRAFAAGLEAELGADPRSAGLVRAVDWGGESPGGAWLEAVGLRGAPMLLDDEGFGVLLERLTEGGVRGRVRRIEALLAAPGPLAQGAAGAAIEDPLDVRGLLVAQIRRGTGAPAPMAGGDDHLSRDGRSLLIRVSPRADPDDLEAAKRLVTIVRAVAERVSADGVAVALAGVPAIAAHSATSIRHDLIWSVVASVISVQVLILFAYRGALASLVILLPASLGIVWAFGAEGLIGGRLTALGAAIGAILVGLGVDYAVHAASSVEPGGGRGAGGRAVTRVGAGIVAAAVTTITAFAALATSNVEILHGFAAIGSMGLAGAVAATIVLMPILLDGRVSPRRREAATANTAGRRAPVMLTVSAVMVGACVVSIAAVALGPAGVGGLAPLDDNLDAMHPSPSPPLEAQRRVDELFAGSDDGLPVLIEASDDVGLAHLAHRVGAAMHTAEAVEAGVRGVIGIDAVIPDPSEAEARLARLAAVDADAVLETLRRVAEGSLLAPGALNGAIERVGLMLRSPRTPTLDELRAEPGLARSLLPADGGGPPAAISYVVLDRTIDRRADRAAVVGELSRLLDGVPGATLTGLPVLGYEAERLVVLESPRLLGTAFLGVLLWLAVLFRRAGDVLLALVPGGFGAIVLLALVAPLGVSLNIVNMAAFPLLVGIGVDNGVFLVSAAREAARDRCCVEALRRRMVELRHAFVVTSLTTVLAFGSLALTSTPAIRSLGLLVGIGVLACLWGALFLLAPILLVLARRGEHRSRGAAL